MAMLVCGSALVALPKVHDAVVAANTAALYASRRDLVPPPSLAVATPVGVETAVGAVLCGLGATGLLAGAAAACARWAAGVAGVAGAASGGRPEARSVAPLAPGAPGAR